MRYSLFSSAILAAAFALVVSGNAVADAVSEWNFNGNLNASHGDSTMTCWGATTSDNIGFATDDVNGVTKTVLNFNAFNNTQGLLVSSAATSDYTMIWDLKAPSAASSTYGVLYQANVSPSGTTTKDGTFAIRKLNKSADATSYEMGTGGVYAGSASFDSWHRIALTVTNLGDGNHSVCTYVDGTPGLVNTIYNSDAFPADIANGGFLLFGDESGETWAGQMSMFYFRNSAMSSSQIAALGGASAAGIAVPEPGTIALGAMGCFGLLAYAWRKRK
jgi:hypothetical protein